MSWSVVFFSHPAPFACWHEQTREYQTSPVCISMSSHDALVIIYMHCFCSITMTLLCRNRWKCIRVLRFFSSLDATSILYYISADQSDWDPRSDQRDGSVSLQPSSQLHGPHHLQRGAVRSHSHGLLRAGPRHLPEPGRPAAAAHCSVQLKVAER